jgi:hypothetical protein
MPPRAAPAGLDVGLALRDGWRAFHRAPGSFVAFTVLATSLEALAQLPLGALLAGADTNPSAWLLGLGGAAAMLAIFLWALCGFARASWSALEGRRPTPACFLRPDPRAIGRLGGALLCLFGLMVGGLLLLALLEAAISLVSGALALLVALLPVPGLVYLAVSQRFLTSIAVLEGGGSLTGLERGRRVVDPHWLSVLGLVLAQLALLALGLLACLIGVWVALPLIACSSTAAYRQLFASAATGRLSREAGR